jgi:hypothetical protein
MSFHDQDLALLRRYQQEAREGKPWPPASPQLVALLEERVPGLKQFRQQRDAARAENQTPRELSSDEEVLALAEMWSREIEHFQLGKTVT